MSRGERGGREEGNMHTTDAKSVSDFSAYKFSRRSSSSRGSSWPRWSFKTRGTLVEVREKGKEGRKKREKGRGGRGGKGERE